MTIAKIKMLASSFATRKDPCSGVYKQDVKELASKIQALCGLIELADTTIKQLELRISGPTSASTSIFGVWIHAKNESGFFGEKQS